MAINKPFALWHIVLAVAIDDKKKDMRQIQRPTWKIWNVFSEWRFVCFSKPRTFEFLHKLFIYLFCVMLIGLLLLFMEMLTW